MAITGSAFLISFGYYCAACIGIFIAFGILRNRRWTNKYYASNCYLPSSIVNDRPPKIPQALLGWIPTVLSFDQQEVLKYAGMDGLTMVRLYYFGLQYSVFSAFICCVAILPTNLSGDEVSLQLESNPESNFSPLDKLSMANIQQKSNLLYVHMAMVYILSFYAYGMLWKYHRDAVGLRINYLSTVEKGAETHTVLVQDVPGVAIGTPLERFSTTLLFFVPEKYRHAATLWFATNTESVSRGSASFFDVLSNTMFDCCLGFSTWLHNSKTVCGLEPMPLPITRVPTDKTLQATSMATVKQLVIGEKDFSAKSSKAIDMPHIQDYINGIPMKVELSAEARAQRMLARGMNPQQVVEHDFRQVFASQYVGTRFVYDTTQLDALCGEYERLATSLTDSLEDWASKARRSKLVGKKGVLKQPVTRVVGARYGAWGLERFGKKPVKVPMLDFFISRMTYLREQILAEQEKAMTKPAPSAFVTFRSRVFQTMAALSLFHHDTSAWTTQAAPAPNDVVWNNLRWRSWERSLRRIVVLSCYVVLVLFYIIPVAAVQGIISATNWLDWLKNTPALNAIYSAIVPTLALKIFLLILPMILRQMSYLEGRVSRVDIDLGLEGKFFGFQYVVVFWGSIISGSLFNQLKKFLHDPQSIVTILGTAAPQTAVFFTNFVMLEALITIPFSLLGVVGLVIFYLRTKLAFSERAKERVWQNQFITYGDNVGGAMLSFLVIVVFAPIFPIMSLFGIIWCISSIICWKYQLCYRQRSLVQGGGRMWPKVYWQILVAIFSMQLMVIAITAVKLKPIPAILGIPGCIFTVLFGVATNKCFSRPLAVMSLRAAFETDDGEREVAPHAPDEGPAVMQAAEQDGAPLPLPASDLYVAPAFKFDENQHEEMMQSASRWKDIFDGAAWTHAEFALPGESDEAPNAEVSVKSRDGTTGAEEVKGHSSTDEVGDSSATRESCKEDNVAMV